MARSITAKYEQLVLEVEFDPVGAAGVYSKACGITDVDVNRTSTSDTSEIDDCDDESLPLSLEREIRAQEVKASGTGSWALQSHQQMMAWWRSGAALNTRLVNTKVQDDGQPGEIYAERGPALLVELNNSRTKGKKVSASISIEFDGVPDVDLVPAP